MNRTVPPTLVFTLIAAGAMALLMAFGRPARNPTLSKNSMVGQPAPDFSGPTADGKTFKLSELKGKVVLLNFWATWCGPCRQEIPDLISLQDQYGARGFQVVGISTDKSLELAATFAKEHAMTYPILRANEEIAQGYSTVQQIPMSFLIGRDGKIAAVAEGLTERDVLAAEIERNL